MQLLGYTPYFYKGPLCYQQQNIDCAIAAWKQTIAMDSRFYGRLAYEMFSRAVYEKQLFSQENLAIVEQGLQQFSNHNVLHFWLARISERQGDYEKAVAYYRSGLSLRPDYARMRFELGRVYYWQGDFDRAVREFQQAVRQAPSEDLYCFFLALSYEAKGWRNAAIDEYRHIVEGGGSYSSQAEGADPQKLDLVESYES